LSKSPSGLIVRDRRTGQPITIPLSTIPKELWPDNWYENAYWMYSRALCREEVAKFFEHSQKEIPEALAEKLAQYIYDYVANIAVAGWLFAENRDEYLEFMRPCLQKLSAKKNKSRTRKDVMDMVHIALEYAVDPF
jgi:hypothetical protein